MQKLLHSIKNITFKRKLIVFSLLLSIVPVVIVGFLSAFLTTQNMQQEVDYNHTSALKQAHYQINNLLKNLQIISIRLAFNPALETSIQYGPNVDNLSQTFEMIDSIKREYSYSTVKFSVSLVYVAQKYVYSDSNHSSNLSADQFMDMVMLNKPIANSSFMVTPNQFQNQPDLLLFRPIPTFSNYSKGILVLHLNVDELIKFLGTLNVGVNSQIFIIDQNGNVIISKNTKDIGIRLVNMTTMEQTKDEQLHLRNDYMFEGVKYKLSFQNSSYNNWTYIVMTPMKELTQKADYIKKMTLLMVAFILLLWVMFAIFGSYRLYFPITLLLKKFMPEQSKQGHSPDGLKVLDHFIDQIVESKQGLEQEIKEQSPYLKQNILQQLLLGEMSEHDLKNKTERYNLPLKGKWFYVCVADVDHYTEFSRKYKEKDRTLIHYVMTKMVEEICEEEVPCLTFVPRPGQVVIIFSIEEANEAMDKWIQHRMDTFRSHLLDYLHLTASVAISTPRMAYSSINQSYQQALELLRYRLMMGHNVTISNDDVEPSVKQLNQSIMDRQKNVVFNVIHGNIEEANVQLSNMIAELPFFTKSTEAIFASITYLLGELEYMLSQMGGHLNAMVNEDVYKQLYQLTTIAEVEKWLSSQVFPMVIEQLQKMTVSKQTKIIQQVLQYVFEHYKSDLSLQGLANEFHISPSHLSRMFKEETNQTFSDYLLEFRMIKAKEWLEHTAMPIKEIADNLRYTSVTNFSRAFKQFYDLPPGQFRIRSMS